MAITGRPSDNGKSTEQRVVGVSEVKSNLVADGVRLVKNLNACRAKFQDIDQRKHVAAAGNLSGIDDSEVVGYLNNTKEIHYKKIIWEKMNKEFAKGNDKLHAKKRKREIGHKKDVHAKKSAKTTEKVENKRTSSKINYNALQKLTDELKQVPVEAELGGLEPKACANGDSAENLKIGFHELEQENEYGEDDDSFRDNDDDSYYGYGTGYYNNSEDFDADY
ncbi:uncharacterized protein LOC125826123 [Solanum verrucosum]|uniref:uncharacterized protein LOC125826123 n=1 Tax=Solanum verrucosum TaxID=315347 RepID=UPI0020D149FF|nr:uncharacterized protein LOC125826123 [Solanum verrucosum]